MDPHQTSDSARFFEVGMNLPEGNNLHLPHLRLWRKCLHKIFWASYKAIEKCFEPPLAQRRSGRGNLHSLPGNKRHRFVVNKNGKFGILSKCQGRVLKHGWKTLHVEVFRVSNQPLKGKSKSRNNKITVAFCDNMNLYVIVSTSGFGKQSISFVISCYDFSNCCRVMPRTNPVWSFFGWAGDLQNHRGCSWLSTQHSMHQCTCRICKQKLP